MVKFSQSFTSRHEDAPEAEKLDINVDREGFLESRTLFPPERVILLVSERDLFLVVGGEEPELKGGGKGASVEEHFCQHPDQSSGRSSAS